MRTHQLRHPLAFLVSAALVAGTSAAQTFIVDDTPGMGADFSSIVEALAVVPDGATLSVRTGVYDGFSLSRPVSIIGEVPATLQPGVIIGTGASFDGAALTEGFTLSRLTFFEDLYIQDVAPTLVLDDLLVRGEFIGVRCDDLRIGRSRLEELTTFLDCLVSISSSTLSGQSGGVQPALQLSGDTKAQIHASLVAGEAGFPCGPKPGCFSTGGIGGDGTPGLRVEAGASVRIVRSTVSGGQGGPALCGCLFDGSRGYAAEILGRLESWDSVYFSGIFPRDPVDLIVDAGVATVGEPFPTLEFSFAGALEQTIGLTVSSTPGSSGRILIGRGPDMSPIPGQLFGQLVRSDRVASLGEAPVSGELQLSFTDPGYPLGTTLWIQVSQTLPGGATQLSNPVAIVVR